MKIYYARETYRNQSLCWSISVKFWGMNFCFSCLTWCASPISSLQLSIIQNRRPSLWSIWFHHIKLCIWICKPSALSLSESSALGAGQCHGCQWSQLLCTKCQWSTSCQKRTCSILAMRFFSYGSKTPSFGRNHNILWNRLLPQRVPWIWLPSRWCYHRKRNLLKL